MRLFEIEDGITVGNVGGEDRGRRKAKRSSYKKKKK
jgi:hypothetical protein